MNKVEYVKLAYTYDPDTGIITSKVTGKQVGYNRRGYLIVTMRDGTKVVKVAGTYIAFVVMTGKPPSGPVVSMNGIKDDLRWSNLRVALRSEIATRPPSPVSGYTPTNHPNVFCNRLSGAYVVRRWELNPDGTQASRSNKAVYRTKTFEEACVVADDWLEHGDNTKYRLDKVTLGILAKCV